MLNNWVVVRSPERLVAFEVREDGWLRLSVWSTRNDPDRPWDEWVTIATPRVVPRQRISAVTSGPDAVSVFLVGFDGVAMEACWTQDDGWNVFPIPGIVSQHPVTAVSRAPGKIDVFRQGPDGRMFTAAWEKGRDALGKWRGWWQIGTRAFKHRAGAPTLPLESVSGKTLAVVARTAGRLDVATVDNGLTYYHAGWDAERDGGKWQEWQQVGGPNWESSFSGYPNIVSRGPDDMDIFGTDVYWSSWDERERTWSEFSEIPGAPAVSWQPVEVVASGRRVDVFTVSDRDFTDAVHHTFPRLWIGGPRFRPWAMLPGLDPDLQRLCAVYRTPDDLHLFAYGDGEMYTTACKRIANRADWTAWEKLP